MLYPGSGWSRSSGSPASAIPRASSDQMISSTMMNGATRPRASHARTAAEPTTIAASQAQAGTRASALPKLDLGEAAGDLPRLGRLRRDADVRCCGADVAQNVVVHRRAAGRGPGRADVEVGDLAHVLLASRERCRAGTHRLPHVAASCEELEGGGQRRDLVVVRRHLQRDVAGKLGEPADVADHERLSEG